MVLNKVEWGSWMACKDLEVGVYGLLQDSTFAFTWRDKGKPQKTLLRIVCSLAKILTGYLWNRDETYLFPSIAGWSTNLSK
jgi:hypothetical protein